VLSSAQSKVTGTDVNSSLRVSLPSAEDHAWVGKGTTTKEEENKMGKGKKHQERVVF